MQETLILPSDVTWTKKGLRTWLLEELDLEEREVLWPPELQIPGAVHVTLQELTRRRNEQRRPPKPPKPAR